MSTAARKARKQAGIKFHHEAKTPTGRTPRPAAPTGAFGRYFASRNAIDAMWRAVLTRGIR